MRWVKYLSGSLLLLLCLFTFSADTNIAVDGACPSTRPPQPPTPPEPPRPPSEPNRPSTPPTPQQPSTPSRPPNQPPSPDTPQPIGPGQSRGPASSAQPSASRPAPGIGLQPLLQSMRMGTLSLAGVVEPWEVWWSNNRDRYLNFREPVEWSNVIDDGRGSKSVAIFPIYNELIKTLADGVSDKNYFIAFRSAISLGKVQDSLSPGSASLEAIEILKKAHETEKQDFVRNNMLLGLGITSDASVVTVIADALRKKENSPLRRSYAALAAGFIQASNSDLIKTLKGILSDKSDNYEVKSCAALSLGNLNDLSAIPLLGKALNQSEGGKKEHLMVRAYAALALGRMAAKEALDELKKVTPPSEKETDVRIAVLMSLGMAGRTELRRDREHPQEQNELKDAILPFLADKYSLVRGYAALALAQTKDPESYKIISEAMHKEKAVDAEGLMILALGLTGDEKAKPDLRMILEAKKLRSSYHKGAAAIGLGLLKDTEAVPILVNILSEEKQQNDILLNPYFILSLGMLKDSRAVEVLQKIWDKLPEKPNIYPCHTNLAIALTMMGRKKDVVIPALAKQATQTKDNLLRSYALHSLGLLGDRESAKLFLDAAADKDNTYVIYTTMSAIGFLMDRNRLNPLHKVTGNLVDVSTQIMDHIGGIPVW
ncbi:MAG: hypothetical protein AB1599_01430 [Planctomycetota bacterium]